MATRKERAMNHAKLTQRRLWMNEMADQVARLSARHASKIDWDAAIFHFNQGKTPEEAAHTLSESSRSAKDWRTDTFAAA